MAHSGHDARYATNGLGSTAVNESREALESTGEQTAPIFVDATGRRRRRLRWLGYSVGTACVGYAIVLAISLSGGPISPDKVLPGYPKPKPSQSSPHLGPPGYVPPNSAMGGGGGSSAAASARPAPGATGAGASTVPPGRPRPSPARTTAPSPSPSSAPSPSATPSDSATPTAPGGGSPPAQPENG
jgi:hypothetical protein